MKTNKTKKGPLGTPLGNPLGYFNSQKQKRSEPLNKARVGIAVPGQIQKATENANKPMGMSNEEMMNNTNLMNRINTNALNSMTQNPNTNALQYSTLGKSGPVTENVQKNRDILNGTPTKELMYKQKNGGATGMVKKKSGGTAPPTKYKSTGTNIFGRTVTKDYDVAKGTITKTVQNKKGEVVRDPKVKELSSYKVNRRMNAKQYTDFQKSQTDPSESSGSFAKRGVVVKKKMAKGGATSFGMLSVKAGIDKNPKATAADRIAGAKKKNKRKK